MDTSIQEPRWRNALGCINGFVAEHPEIKVSASCLAVPKSCREDFYAILDQARFAMVHDALAQRDLAESGKDASEEPSSVIRRVAFADECVTRLNALRTRVAQATGANLVLPAEMESFCKDRILGCSEPFVGRLLSFVQGTVDADTLYQEVRQQVLPLFDLLSVSAYETWLAYSLVVELGAKKAYLADTFDQKTVVACATDTLPIGRQAYSAVLRLPEAVFDCGGNFWAIKLELAQELDFYGSKPLRRRDFSAGGDTRNTLGRRYLMLYKIPDLDSIPIVANRDKTLVYPPTAMVGALRPEDFAESLYARASMQRVLTMAPRAGAAFVALDGCEQAAQETVDAYQAPVEIVSDPFDLNQFSNYLETLSRV
ncbi:MAG: hypothetical protein PUD02_02315 [Eggerthellales bacterium]|nr:hypothetical protein [Eggerthellales bacterium]